MCYSIIQTECNNSLPSGQNTSIEEFRVFIFNVKIPGESKLPFFCDRIILLYFSPSPPQAPPPPPT